MDANYAAAESWFGSYYELAIEVSVVPDDARLQTAIERLWSCEALVAGPWPDKADTRNVFIPAPPAPEEIIASYGMFHVADLGTVRCVSWIIRETARGSDWLDLSIPTAALEPFGLAYPLVSETSCALIEKLDRALLDVAVSVHRGVEFQLGVIGEEVSGMWSSAILGNDDIAQGGFVLSEQLAQRVGAVAVGERVAPGLRWVGNKCEERFEKVSQR